MLRLLMQPQRELQLYLKTNNTQNCQKIKLYGSLTTEDLKKPHSSRQEGGAELRYGVERLQWWRNAVPHSHVVDKNREGYLGSQQSQSQPQSAQPRGSGPGR